MPRSDLLDLLSVQDKIANRAKDIAGLMLGRCMTIPQPLQPQMLAYVQRTVDASAQALKALRNWIRCWKPVSVAAKPHSSKRWSRLEEIERETDRMQITVRRALFNLEKDLPAVDVIFLYKIIRMDR